MSDDACPAELEARLFEEIEKTRFGMLGPAGDGSPQHLQPMTAYVDPEEKLLWFFSRRSSDLTKDAGPGAQALFCLMSKDQELQASLIGDLEEVRDRARVDAYWNPVAAAWFPDGKDDPELTLLRFRPRDAQVWRSRSGPVKFLFEIARANASGREPDLGVKSHFTLI